MDKKTYLDEINEMLNSHPGYTTFTLRHYLARLERELENEFDPIRAIEDLQEVCEILKKRLEEAA